MRRVLFSDGLVSVKLCTRICS